MKRYSIFLNLKIESSLVSAHFYKVFSFANFGTGVADPN